MEAVVADMDDATEWHEAQGCPTAARAARP
jgi:hypothetical protein